MLNQGFMRFGGGGETLLTPLGIAFLLLACILILTIRRKYLIAPVLFATIMIPISEQIVVGGLHFTSMRILIACAWIRVAPELFRKGLKITRVDQMVIAWAFSGAIAFTLLWAQTDAFVNRLGVLYDCFGMYFLLRMLVPDLEAVYRVLKALSVLAFVLGICLLVEHLTAHNVFDLLGGKAFIPELRNGQFRAQGPFAHEILAGCFGATILPLFIGLWWQKNSRWLAVLGIVGATLITYSSFSSTAIMAWVAGPFALTMWLARRYMRVIRWGIVITIIGLHMVMKAPVWALIGRIDLTGASSSYHRFELVNQTILHFSEWWLFGIKTTYQWGLNLWDTSNTYVETATTGGLLTLILFIAIIVYSFKGLGKTRKATKDPQLAKLTWILGSALFAHLVAFVGISYYDQSIAAWYLLVAMMSTVGYRSLPARVAVQKQEKLPSAFAPASSGPIVVGRTAYNSLLPQAPAPAAKQPFVKSTRG